MRRNIALLTMCQALLFTGGVVLASTAVLVGSHLSTGGFLATLPLVSFNLGVMASALPASMLMKRVGRRWGFALGGIIGVVGAGVASVGVASDAMSVFCGGMAVLGVFMAFGGFYRFAAAEAAPPERRSRAVGYVTGGGLAAAFAGTWLSVLTHNVSGLPEFTASYVVVGATAVLTVPLAMLLDMPTPTKEECARCGRPLATIARQPEYVVAVIAGALGYFVMGLIMNATPLAMTAHAFTFGTIALVIQWHVVAMFAPSFFTGSLISRIDVLRVLALGAALTLACVGISLLGETEAHVFVALVSLGLGWNFLYIGGTTLLTRTYRPEERAKSQGFNDMVVYSTITLAALASGGIQSAWGWYGVNAAAVPAIAVILAAVTWLARSHRPGRTP